MQHFCHFKSLKRMQNRTSECDLLPNTHNHTHRPPKQRPSDAHRETPPSLQLALCKRPILETRRQQQQDILGEHTPTPPADSLWNFTEVRKVFQGGSQRHWELFRLNATTRKWKLISDFQNCLMYPSLSPPNNGQKWMIQRNNTGWQ